MRICNRTRADLLNIQEETRRERALGEGALYARVTVHLGTCGMAAGADAVLLAFREALRGSGRGDIAITTSGCIGLCSLEPLVTVETAGGEPVLYQLVDTRAALRIFDRHVQQGEAVTEFALARGLASDAGQRADRSQKGHAIPHISHLPFFSFQKPLVLGNRGLTSPDHIEDAILRDGYQAAAKALLDLTPEAIIGALKASGLRGRGEGGIPVGIEWAFAASASSAVKYVICHAGDADPCAFVGRGIMDAYPHKVIEGMIIAARAIGAHQGYLSCPAAYPLTHEKLGTAVEQAAADGLLGRDILGSGFDFHLDIHMVADLYSGGEKTALIASIQGERGIPRPTPPFPVTAGLFGKPTIVGRAETFANVPEIIRGGAGAFAAIGTASSKGTKVLSLTGQVMRTGLIEVSMGTSLRRIIFDIGGGTPDGRSVKAVQLGGPFGVCIPERQLDITLDYETIAAAGATMGSGGIIVMDGNTCMVEMARYFMACAQEACCGGCTPCRVGTRRMHEILLRLSCGEGEAGDIGLLEKLAHTVKETALCRFGRAAPNPVLSTLHHFRHEYESHRRGEKCEAPACVKISESPCINA